MCASCYSDGVGRLRWGGFGRLAATNLASAETPVAAEAKPQTCDLPREINLHGTRRAP